MSIGHYKEIRKLMVWALALRQNESIRKGLMPEMSAFESCYGGQLTLSTQLIKPNYL